MRIFHSGTVEYLKVSVTADVLLDEQTVEFSLDDKTTWLAAEWHGEPGLSRQARLLLNNANMPDEGVSTVYVRITDGIEKPVVPAGAIKVK